MTLYRDLFARALRTTWQQKLLWGFALLAALPGTGGAMSLVLRGTDSLYGQASFLGTARELFVHGSFQAIWTNMITKVGDSPAQSVLAIVGSLVGVGLFFLLSIIGQTALIAMLIGSSERMSTRVVMATTVKLLWRVVVVNLIVVAIKAAVVIIIALPAGVAFVMSGATAWLDLYIATMYVVMIPLSIVLVFLAVYAMCAIAQGQGWKGAIVTSWNMFRNNWLVTLEVSVLLYAITVTVTSVIVIVLALVGLPSNQYGIWTVMAVQTIAGTILTALQYVVWVFVYLALQQKGVRSKLQRVTDQWTTTVPATQTKNI